MRYARFAWAGLAYTALVILFGAVVRVTGSGAGCGQHWPSCNGDLLHVPERVETVIEISHRLTSGLALLASVVVFVWSRRIFSRSHLAYRAASWVLGLMIVECLIGAGLVLGRLVDQDTSFARALVMPLHLASASLLCAAFAVTAWGAKGSGDLEFVSYAEKQRALRALTYVLLLSMTGAVTALGDTLFPLAADAPLDERLGSTSLHFLQTLRIFHPVLAVFLAALLFAFSTRVGEEAITSEARAWARGTRWILAAQLLIGGVNVLLSAPAWMQIVHLAFALGLWLAVVLMVVSGCRSRNEVPRRGVSGSSQAALS